MMKKREFLKQIFLLFLISIFLDGCAGRVESKQNRNEYIPPVNEDGLIVIQMPKTLLGGHTAEELEAEEAKDNASRKNSNKEELDNDLWVTMVANDDGTVSYYFTPEQYQRTKDCYYNLGCLRDTQTAELQHSFVESAEYTDIDAGGIPWGLVVTVNGDAYHSIELWNSALVTITPAIMLGRYQIMCGISGDEWSVHVVVMDAANGDIIEETDFPTRDK